MRIDQLQYGMKRMVWLCLVFIFLASCDADNALHEYQLQGSAMGTTWSLIIISKHSIDYQALKAQVKQRLEVLEQIMSHYRPDSELSQLNRLPLNTWQNISVELYDVLDLSKKISQKSTGAFDITLGKIVNAWGFGNEKRGELPAPLVLESLLGDAGMANYELNHTEGPSQFMKRSDFHLDLSAVAKGYAVDEITEWLDEHNFNGYLMDIGGEVKAMGHNAQQKAWRIAIEKPRFDRQIQRIVQLSNQSIATSGNYRNYYEVGGKKYSHIINHMTGAPVDNRVVSASVISDNTAVADAWATALLILPFEQMLALTRIEELPVYLMLTAEKGEGFVEYMSPLFEQYLAP